MPIQTNYLNPKNPDVQMHYTGWQRRGGIPTRQPLTPEQLRSMELDFLSRLTMFQQERELRSPSFLALDRNTEIKAAYQQFKLEHGIGFGYALSNAEYDEFERQFAAKKVAEHDTRPNAVQSHDLPA